MTSAVRVHPVNGAATDYELLLDRAIGVTYRSETERMSYYQRAQMGNQFDAVLHFDQTRAAEPLERDLEWESVPFHGVIDE